MNFTEKWIWLPEDKYPERQNTVCSSFKYQENSNYTVAEFKREYSYDKTIEKAELRFSADTAVQLYVNSEIVATGPASVGGDYFMRDMPYPEFIVNGVPRLDFYSSVISINPGSQKLDLFARVRMMPTRMCEFSKGRGGFMLWGVLYFSDGTKTVISTDKTWSARRNGAYESYASYNGTIKADEYVNAQEIVNEWHTKTAPIPVCTEEKINIEDNIIRVNPKEEKRLTLELDKIYGGYLDIKAKSNGRVKMKVKCSEGGNGGIEESIILAGEGSYRGFVFHSAGVMAIDVVNESEEASIIEVNFIASYYPVDTVAKTTVSDDEMNKVLEIARHTLKICRRSHHLDSTSHCEPLSDPGDYYIETLMTVFSFMDMRLAEFDILRIAELLRNTNGKMFHTSYGLIWVRWLYDTYMLTGNTELLRGCEEALILLLERYEGYIGDNNLIETPPDYMFVDWIYIDGISMHHPPKALGQTALNIFWFGALDYASKIFDVLGEAAMAEMCRSKRDITRKAVNEILFDSEKGMYFEGLNTKTPAEMVYVFLPQNVEKRYYLKHSNILAAYYGICDKKTAKELIHKIMSDECPGVYQPYFAHYLLEAVEVNGLKEEYTLKILELWKKPVLEFTKGLVEGFYPPEPNYGFDHSHAWGGTPLYSLPKALTGFRIDKPGMEELTFSPSLLGLKSARVELPTPYGMVVCEMEQGKETVITHPEEIRINIR